MNLLLALALILVSGCGAAGGGDSSSPSVSTGFTKYGANPIYGPVAGYRAVYSPYILVEDGTFRMWHQESDVLHDNIGYSTSQDGTTFAFGGIALTHGYSDPAVFSQSGNLSCRISDRADTWDCLHVGDPSVVKVGAQYYMFYSGAASTDGRGDIGLALSPDGVNWVKYSENPVLRRTPGSYDDWWAQQPSVIYDGSLFHMWYSAKQDTSPVREARIGYATSQDGINWTKQGVVLEKTVGSWDNVGVSSAEAVKIGSTFLMAYQHSTLREFGMAVSSDGRTWTKCVGNPILVANPAGWDQQITTPFLMTDPGNDQARLRIYYGGWRYGAMSLSNPASLGLAIGFANPMCR
jgi:hypothetical protein